MKKKILTIIGYISLIILPFSIVSFIICIIVYNKQFKRTLDTKYSYRMVYSDYPNLAREEISFYSKKKKLNGYIYGNHKNPKGLVVISHGIGSGHENYFNHIEYFTKNDYLVFGFDNTGSRISEGNSTRGLSQSLIDLNNALNYIKTNKRINGLPIHLFGHSWGGYAVCSVLNYHKDIKTIFSVAGYNDPKEMFAKKMVELIGGFGYVMTPYCNIYQFLLFGKVLNKTATSGLNSSTAKGLIIQGGKDYVVNTDTVSIYASRNKITNPNIKIYFTDNGGHVDIIFSHAEIKYSEEINEKRKKLEEEYNGNIPDEKMVEFFNNVDRHLMNEPNKELLDKIIGIIEK